jgi:ABC-type transport system involved in multi-copper enzyme maturation permease subunit
MSEDFVSLFFACSAVMALIVAGFLPLLLLAHAMREKARTMKFWLWVVIGSVFGNALIASFLLDANSYAGYITNWGRIAFSLVHLLWGVSFLIVVLWVLLKIWPKGGAVALAAFQEGIRQPMYWLMWGFAMLLITASPIIPYFTFGEDLKMVKQICFALTMLAPAAFGVIAASISVSEEIEGRTAVTLLSKPISRRQFLLGKYVGILLAALSMTITLGWWLIWVVLYKRTTEARLPASVGIRPDPAWAMDLANQLLGHSSGGELTPTNGSHFARGVFFWVADAGEALPSLVIGFCLVMVMLSIAVALGTRLPMVVNIPACIIIFFLGNLAPILREVTADQLRLISFVAGVFQTILPGLDLFDVGSANVRDLPLPLGSYSLYTLNAFLYACVYSAIALLFGLILFEDRDVA